MGIRTDFGYEPFPRPAARIASRLPDEGARPGGQSLPGTLAVLGYLLRPRAQGYRQEDEENARFRQLLTGPFMSVRSP